MSDSLSGASGSEDPAITSRAELVYSHCVLKDSVTFSAFSNQLRQLAANAALNGLSQAERVSDSHIRAELVERLIEASLDAGDIEENRFRSDIENLRHSLRNDLSVNSATSAIEGRILLALGDRVGAKADLELAIFYEGQRSLPSRLPDWYLVLADVVPEHRTEYVHAAYVALENVRPLLPLRDPITDESTFSLHMRPVFEAAIDVDLAEHGGEIAPEAISQAQDVIETYRQAEIRSAFGDHCVPPLPRMNPSVLRRNEIVLYPILLADRVELLVATGHDRRWRRLPPNTHLNRTTIVPVIAHMREAVSRPSGDTWREDSSALYSALIGPIENLLGPDKTLVIVPDGALRILPWSALMNENGKFLFSQTRLAIAPSLSYTQPGDNSSGQNASVVAAYLNRSVSIDGQRFEALAATRDEAADAADATHDNKAGQSGGAGQIIENFSKPDLERALSGRDVDVLHLATHASFSGRSDESFLVASDGKVPMSDLGDMIATKRSRGGKMELLVLSACETAVSDDEASMGFAGTAVQAGAQSALASLWDVNDPSTEKLMKEFYSHYRDGESRAEALRSAQVATEKIYKQPYYWAPFVLIGAWR